MRCGEPMAKPKPEKKPASTPPAIYVLPIELRIGDRFVGETGEEWEVISRPYASADDRLVSAHVRRVGRPELSDLRTWCAHERVSVKRASA
jgi:hypothetical protein